MKQFPNIQTLTKDATFAFLNTLPAEQDAYLRMLKQAAPLRTLLPNNSTSNEVFKLALKPATPRESNDRIWKTLFISSCANDDPQNQAKIEIRTRNDDPSKTVPERLYSSLKYEISHSIPVALFGQETAVIMAKVQVVNPYKHEDEIVKNNGKTVLKGASSMTPITVNATQDMLTCKQKIQFTDVSYHHEKKFFAIKISYYKPSNLQDPILVMLSAPFQVFARRPRKSRRTVKKRKKTEEEDEDVKITTKKRKAEAAISQVKTKHPTEDSIKQEILKFLDIFEKYQDVVQNLDEDTKNKLGNLLQKFAQPIKLEDEFNVVDTNDILEAIQESPVSSPVSITREEHPEISQLPIPSSNFETLPSNNELDLDSLFDFTD